MQHTQDRQNHLAWIDLEMTGLNPDHDVILEIATIVTDADLNVVAEGPVLAISAPPDLLAGMDAWNQKQHRKSGRLDRVLASPAPLASAEQQTPALPRRHRPPG